MRICLDPGHGQYANKGYAPGYFEGTQMFKLAYKLKAALEKYPGITALVVTRPKITSDPGLWERGAMAKGFDLFYSLHSNAPGSSGQTAVHGVSVYDSFEKHNIVLATNLGVEIARIMDSYPRGVNHRESTKYPGQDWYGVLRSAIRNGCKSAILMEHGFHTNPDESAWLMLDYNLDKLAAAEAKVIAAHYGLIPVTPPPSEEDEEMYCKRGDGSVANPNARVMAVQLALLALGYKLINPVTGAATIADGSYGPGCAGGVLAFKKAKGLPGDGDTFDLDCVTALLVALMQFQAALGALQTTNAKLEKELGAIKLIIAQLIPYAT